jgi:mRNA interferase RelE/StbE
VASYRIELKRSAAKEIAKIKNERERRRIVERIEKLGSDPRPLGSEKLTGSEHYRVRQGQYRIIYSISDDVLLIEIVKVGHRRDVYR